jgi:transcriptional regulator with XRE-family HTH domain
MWLRYLFPYTVKIAYTPWDRYKVANPVSFGEHIRNKRVELQINQKQAAELLHTTMSNVWIWENNVANPLIMNYPAIVSFLGYEPFTIDNTTLAGRIKYYRYKHGLTQEQLAKLIPIDESVLASYESEKHVPLQKNQKKIDDFIANK